MKPALLSLLAVFTGFYALTWGAAIRRKAHEGGTKPTPLALGIGFVTNFFDTLGIGSFATSTAMFRFWKIVRDEQIPGTLNVGHTLPTITQAFIYIVIVQVDALTLVLLIASSILGAWLGAGVVARWSRRKVQIGMGLALMGFAGVLLYRQLTQIAEVGTQGLEGTRLAIGIVGNFVLGALMTLGIGLYAPCLVMIALLGMNPKAAFPIMMGSCAFLMPVGSAQFIRAGAFDLKTTIGLAIGGIPAVLIAAYLVKELPLEYVFWLVIVVVVYTAVMMLRAAATEARAKPR